jgi:hypothetical protein
MWRVFWVPQDALRKGIRRRALAGWQDLALRENQTGIKAGDPILLSPDCSADGKLLVPVGRTCRAWRRLPS